MFYLIKKHIFLESIIQPVKFSRKIKHGYIHLIELLYHNCNKNDLAIELKHLENQMADGRYIGGYTKQTLEFDSLSFTLDYFYDVLNYLISKNETFILNFEWNSTVEDLNRQLESVLGKVFNDIKIPLNNDSDNRQTTQKDILLDYQEALYRQNIQMAFIDDESDTYYIILHCLSKEKEVVNAISEIGFEYSKTLTLD